MTKCTASWEPSDVSFQSNMALKIMGDHFTPPPLPQKMGYNGVNDDVYFEIEQETYFKIATK